MPTYCYATKDGKTVEERFYPIAKKPTKIRLKNGKWAYYSIAATHGPSTSSVGDLWPRWSDAAGCSPRQIAEQKAHNKKMGIEAEYNEVGQVKFESVAHEKAFCESQGFYQLNSFGGKRWASRDGAKRHENQQSEQSYVE